MAPSFSAPKFTLGYQPQPSVPRRRLPPLTSSGRSRSPGGIEYLDRWSPRIDQDHYDRVRLYRKRKDLITRHEQERKRRRTCLSIADEARLRDIRTPSIAESCCPSEDSTLLQSSTGAVTPSNTSTSELSLTFSNLGSTFQDELDTYNMQIKTLQEGEWPTLPDARAPALRVNHSESSSNEPRGSKFGRQTAQALKSWSMAQGFLYGGSTASLRDTDRVHDAASYEPGVIFSAPYHTSNTKDERWVSVMDPHNTATPFGIVHSKYRKLVVVRTFGEHCICVPIYSNNGRGLEGKKFLQEWISIRDVADKSPAAPEGPNLKVLAVGNPDFRGLVVRGRSSIKMSEICSHRFDAPATIEGKLLDGKSLSRKRLLELVKSFR